MKYYKLRVDLENANASDIIDILETYSELYAYCYEGGVENPHMHCYFETQKTAHTIRLRIRALGLKGNASYSLKSIDERFPIEYLAYMMKESNYNFDKLPPDIITLAKEYNEKVQAEMKTKKEKKKRIIDILIELVEEKLNDKPKDYDLPTYVLDIIMEYHLDKKLLIRKHSIECYHTTILYNLFPEMREHFLNTILYESPISQFYVQRKNKN